MITIRQMMIDGHGYNDIITQLAGTISERTFWRYVSKIFAQDIKNLQKMNNEQMMRAVCVHLERCSNIYRGLQALAADNGIDAESRRLCYNDMYKLSQSVVREITNAPVAAVEVQRKLKAISRGESLSSTTEHTSSYSTSSLEQSRYRPVAPLYDPQPMTEQQQQEREQEQQEPQQQQQ